MHVNADHSPLKQHRTLASAVADRLREQILSSAYPAGTQLRQDALAASFGVSRIPVREALFQLEAEGLLQMVPHKGAVVTELSPEEVNDIFDLRVMLGPVGESELAQHRAKTPCDDAPLRARIAAARERQWRRQACLNAALPAARLEERLEISAGAGRLLASGRGPLAISLRSRHRCLRVARSLADLAGATSIEEVHLAEALALRRALGADQG